MNIKVTGSYNCPFKTTEWYERDSGTGDIDVLCNIQNGKRCSWFVEHSPCPLMQHEITVTRVEGIYA